MSDRMWERIGAATGILSVLLFVGAFLTGTESPEFESATAEQAKSWMVENSAQLRLFTVLIALSSLFLLWFLGSLRGALLRAEGASGRLTSIAFGAGLMTVATYFVSAGLTGQTLAFKNLERLEPEVARDLFAIGEVGFGPVGVGTLTRAAMVGAAALVILRFGGLPRWLGWVGAVVAAASFVGVFTMLESPPTEGPLGGVWFFSWLLFHLWLLLASIVLVTRAGGAGAQEQT